MRKETVLAAMCASLICFGCLASLEKYPKEKCTDMPNENVVKAIHDNCIKCHTKDYTTALDICVRKNMIIDAVRSGRMPKMGKLYDYYKEAIVNWK